MLRIFLVMLVVLFFSTRPVSATEKTSTLGDEIHVHSQDGIKQAFVVGACHPKEQSFTIVVVIGKAGLISDLAVVYSMRVSVGDTFLVRKQKYGDVYVILKSMKECLGVFERKLK
jgi:hypothetical protein